MNEIFSTLGCMSVAVLVAQTQTVMAPGLFKDISALAIVAFVVYYTLTRINRSQEHVASAITKLAVILAKVEGIKLAEGQELEEK